MNEINDKSLERKVKEFNEDYSESIKITINLPQYIVKHIEQLARLANKTKEELIIEFICQELESIADYPNSDTLGMIINPFVESIQDSVHYWKETLFQKNKNENEV